MEPGRVLYGGRGAVVVGEIDGATTKRVQDDARAARNFDPDAMLTANIWGYLWGKLGYGALLFATALTNKGIADALRRRGTGRYFRGWARKRSQWSPRRGVRLQAFNGYEPAAFLPGAPQPRPRARFDAMVAHNRRSAKTHSGIWRDLAVRKRKTEMDAQIAHPSRSARPHGINMPIVAGGSPP